MATYPFPESEYSENALMSGYLVKQGRTLRKNWKRRYFVLHRNDSDGLQLLYFTVSKGKLRKTPKGLLQLDSGCVVRKLLPSETGGRTFCFHLLTSNGQLKLQATSEAEREKWSSALDAQIKYEIDFSMYIQKQDLVAGGGDMTWHRRKGDEIPVTINLNKTSSALVLRYDTNTIQLGFYQIENITPGKQSSLLRLLDEERIKDRNCISLKLKTPSEPFGETLDLELANQNIRDDWASALQAMLHGPPKIILPAGATPAARVAADKRSSVTTGIKVRTNGLNKPKTAQSKNGSKASHESHSSSDSDTVDTPTSSAKSNSPITADNTKYKPRLSTGSVDSKRQKKNKKSKKKSRKKKKNKSSVDSTKVVYTQEESDVAGDAGLPQKSNAITARTAHIRRESKRLLRRSMRQTPTTVLRDVEVFEENVLGNTPNPNSKKRGFFKPPELTELFKTKMRLQEGIPYGLCVSKALNVAIQEIDMEHNALLKEQANQSEAGKPDLPPKLPLFKNEDFTKKKHFNLGLPINQIPANGGPVTKKEVSIELYDYAGHVFRRLRSQYGIDEEEYLNSLSELTGDGFMGNGKSGMLFFFTKDRKYVLKTVKQSETDLFVNKGMIQGYYEHMQQYSDSLICRFLGFYRIKIAQSSISNKWMGLVIMSNTYDTPLVMHEKYDLKGSTRKRWCEPKFGSVLKDLNFTGKLYIDEEDRGDMIKQIRLDAEFMLAYNVMDYSLLLGIYRPLDAEATRNLCLLSIAEDHNPTKDRKGVSRWQRDYGGIEARTPDGKPEVYVMCLIDILQVYDFSKRAENIYKSTVSEAKEISAIEPKKYLERFMAYVDSIVVGVNGANKQIQEDRERVRRNLRNSRANIDEETAAAFKRVADDKANTSGMTFTFTLEDGTVVESFEDGTKVQREPGGVVIRQNKDGSIVQTNTDGMVIERKTNGTFVQNHPDGTVIVIYATTESSDDTPVVSSRQTLPNGTVIESFTNGTRKQQFADGTIIEIDKEGNKKQTETNGTVVQVFADGRKVQNNVDGTTIETLVDGTKHQHFPDGKLLIVRTDGTTSIIDNGKEHNLKQNVSKQATKMNGTSNVHHHKQKSGIRLPGRKSKTSKKHGRQESAGSNTSL